MVGSVEQRESRQPTTVSATVAANVNASGAANNMATLLRDSKDLRVFAMDAMGRPEAGGVTYAAYAVGICRAARVMVMASMVDWTVADLPYTAPEDPRTYAAKNESYKRIKAACQSFSDDKTGDERDIQLRAQEDTLQKLSLQVKAAVASNDPSQRKSALAAVLDNGDPLLVSEQLERLLLEKTPQGLAYWIDGKQVPAMNSGILQAALGVLPCALGLVCDERSALVLGACLNTGKCYTDQIEMVLANLPDDSQRAQLKSTLASLESAVRERRIGRFLP